ncbi:heterokaryon incompatibility protein-domain-containing protein [Cadophora sp. MPI-SDFR-AT-0126]|nr:heterokaryon incompatibility protein-domain-containing protein [Leotiomycetes sp. MPI-SDFR-AT-0126]
MEDSKSIPILTYTPLSRSESVRVLLLHPSENHSSPLLCDLLLDDRDEMLLDPDSKRRYEAVSYTWGDPIFSHEIICHDGTARLAITPNVDSLLRYMRKKKDSRRLWIDAICLNQADNDEKRIQVGLMGDIYRQARKVHVWLGDGHGFGEETGTESQQTDRNDLPKFIGLLRAISVLKLEPVKQKSPPFSTARSPSRVSVRETILKFFPNDKELYVQAQEFLHSPWFQRRWTIQEAALNDQTIVRVGSSKISWENMSNALEVLQSGLAMKPALDAQALGALNTALSIRSQPETVLDLLYKYHEAQCCDPRDRIAALLSVASGPLAQWTPNYDTSWALNYKDFTLCALHNGFVGDVFQHLTMFGGLYHKEVPSWVPDWSCRRLSKEWLSDVTIALRNFDARWAFSVERSLPVLSFGPLWCANIACVFDRPGDMNPQTLRDFFSSYMDSETTYNSSRFTSRGEVHRRNISALEILVSVAMDRPHSVPWADAVQSNRIIGPDLATTRKAVKIWLSGGKLELDLERELIRALQALLRSHTFFKLHNRGGKTNIWGLAAYEIQIGDILAETHRYSSGGEAMILRRQAPEVPEVPQSTSDFFRIVGFCGYDVTGKNKKHFVRKFKVHKQLKLV